MLPLEDLKRLKITNATRAWLAAEARLSRRTLQQVAREELHRIAVTRIHAARIVVSMAPREDHMGDGELMRSTANAEDGVPVPFADLRHPPR